MLDPTFNLYGLQVTTNPGGPMVLVGGPLAQELEVNGGGNAFGQGWQANATIGRAVRLVLLNIGGAVPQSVDRATHGSPASTRCAWRRTKRAVPGHRSTSDADSSPA